MLQPTLAASVLLMYTATPPDLPTRVVHTGRSCVERWSLSKRAALPDLMSSNEQFAGICALQANWDGYGGSPIHADTALNARAALTVFQQSGVVPDIVPNPNGTISFEWSNSRGEAHVEIGKSRFVGLIQPNGTAYIPIAGETRDAGQYYTYLRSIAVVVEAVLYPPAVPSLTSSHLAASHVRQAA